MKPIRVSKLEVVLPVDLPRWRIYDHFRAVLDASPLSHTALAKELGVTQSTVSRWASGDSHPSLQQMLEALDVIERRLSDVAEKAKEARKVTDAVQEVVALHDRYVETREKKDLLAFGEASDRLRAILGEDDMDHEGVP